MRPLQGLGDQLAKLRQAGTDLRRAVLPHPDIDTLLDAVESYDKPLHLSPSVSSPASQAGLMGVIRSAPRPSADIAPVPAWGPSLGAMAGPQVAGGSTLDQLRPYLAAAPATAPPRAVSPVAQTWLGAPEREWPEAVVAAPQELASPKPLTAGQAPAVAAPEAGRAQLLEGARENLANPSLSATAPLRSAEEAVALLVEPPDRSDLWATPAAAVAPASVAAAGGPPLRPAVVESAAADLTDNLANVAAPGIDIAPVIVADMQEAAATAAAPSRRPSGPRLRMANRRRQQMQQESPELAVVVPADADRKAGGPDVQAFLAQALSSPDFGAGAAVREALNRAADALAGDGGGRPGRQERDLRRTAALAGWALPAGAAAASVGIPVMMAAADGNEAAGGGGALVQGAGALAGAALGGRYGTIGRLVGGTVGGAAAGFPVDWARGAVDAKNAGDGGLAGALGRMADPLIDSSREIEERQLRAQLNSPVVKMMEERKRQERHEALMAQMQAALLQSYFN